MKQLAAVLLAATLMLVWSVSLASAGMYVSGNLVGVVLEDSAISYRNFNSVDNDELSFDIGFGFAAALGYATESGFRVEGEIAGRFNEMDEFSNDLGDKFIDDGYISAFSVMANAFYNFMPDSAVSPFIGAGVGLVGIEVDFDYDDDDYYYHDGHYHYYDDSDYDTVLAYQLAAGVTFALSEHMKVDVQYRYFAADDPEFDEIEMEYTTQNAMVGLRYEF